ncbi:MAG: DUF1501 domain-containing protein [Roseibacillus sp.]|nr:DUF1501 domain-containing protein [Roseibacillus sp.]
MLTIADQRPGTSRRALLRLGSLGLAGLSLPSILASRAAATRTQDNPLKDKCVIFLFQQGGPSQLETFDPKMDVPSEVRTVGGTTRTSLTGVHYGATMQRLAKLAHKLTVVRSFTTRNAGHNIQPIVSPSSHEANIGTHYARVAGATRRLSGMPTNTVIFPRTVLPGAPKPEARGNLAATGPYNSSFAPFLSGGGGELQQDMTLQVNRERFLADRRELLGKLDGLNRSIDVGGRMEALDELQQQAFQVLLNGHVSNAFDLSREDPRVVSRYDTARFAKPGQWNKVSRGRKGYYTAQAQSLGKLLLTARRLCEAGCGFVTIHAGYAGVWDMHADGNNLNMQDGMQAVGRSFDHAVAEFILDCEARGLGDKILLVCTGEMGRTPKLNKRGGRDHWARLAPLLLYGGGMEGGRVIGRSTHDGGEPNSTPYGPDNLISTLLNTMIDIGKLRLAPSAPKEVLELAGSPVIPGVVTG